jgi:predicted negative regulator of RcsB-dependent stress response
MKNYRNEEEAAGIYGYVITHFDSEYVVSRIADYRLAGVEVQLRKERQALDRLKALRASEGEPLHGAARFDHGSRRMVTAEEHLKEEMEALEVWKKQTPQAMFRAARGLAKDEKLTEHIELVNGYPDDAELQRLIKSDLTRKQAESATADENRALIQAIRQEPSRN